MKKNGTLDFDTERDGPTFFCLILEPPSFFSFLLLRLSDFQTSLNLSFFSLPKYNTPCETKAHAQWFHFYLSLFVFLIFFSFTSFFLRSTTRQIDFSFLFTFFSCLHSATLPFSTQGWSDCAH